MDDAIVAPTEEFSTEKPSLSVVTLIADLEETSPSELTPPLYSAIDPEALDALFDSSSAGSAGSSRQISFTYCGYEVYVGSEGDITATEL